MAAKEHKERKELLAEHGSAPLDCGGRAQRRHRFSTGNRASKAAWRFASRRSPKFRSGSYVALYSLRFLAILGALALPSVFSYAEDLTTLGGKTFTNITEVTKYPKLVVFTYNSNRTSVAISNLPELFRSKYGIQITTNTITTITQQSTSAIDVFFTQHRDSKLEVEKSLDEFVTVTNDADPRITENPGWSIKVTPKGFNLELGRILWSHEGTNVNTGFIYSNMAFGFAQEALANQIFTKFIEWGNVAATNSVEPFKKELASFPDSEIEVLQHTFTFNWQAGKVRLDYSDPVTVAYFSKMDVSHFQELLKFVPDLKQELAQKIRNQDAQQSLFK